MDRKFRIIVEGKEDYFFLKNYLSHVFKDSNCRVEILEDLKGDEKEEANCLIHFEKYSLSIHLNQIEGKYNLDEENIRSSIDEGLDIIIVFDANEDTKKEVSKKLRGLKYKLFLFPDNRSKGNLEALLEQIILPDKQDIFECFENYERCLEERNKGYQLPDKKAKIYSYKEALGALAEKHREAQFKPEYWNFDSPALDPLKKFLLENLR